MIHPASSLSMHDLVALCIPEVQICSEWNCVWYRTFELNPISSIRNTSGIHVEGGRNSRSGNYPIYY